jgi:hypothetical protein
MRINLSPTPIAARQTCSVAFAGAAPEQAGKAYDPFYRNGVYEYSDPDDRSLVTLDQGGLYDFGEGQTGEITEFRAPSGAGNVIIAIEDRDGTHSTEVYNGAGIAQSFHPTIPILPSQRVKITTVGSGWFDLYVTRSPAV